MSGNAVFGDAITATYTDERYDLGTERHVTAQEMVDWISTSSGPGTAIFVFNDEAATAFAQGSVVVRDVTTAGGYDAILAAGTTVYPAIRILGVAQHAIAAGSFGWVLKRGIGEVMTGTTTITADTAVVCEDAGNATDVGSAKNWETEASGVEEKGVFAYATETTALDALCTCYISVP